MDADRVPMRRFRWVVKVLGTGVRIRLADTGEVRAVRRWSVGLDADLVPARSYRFVDVDGPTGAEGVLVVSQTFVEVDADGLLDRWVGYEEHGRRVVLRDDATVHLARIAEDTAREGLVDLLG